MVFQDLSFLLLTREISCLLSGFSAESSFCSLCACWVWEFSLRRKTLFIYFIVLEALLIVLALDPAAEAALFFFGH